MASKARKDELKKAVGKYQALHKMVIEDSRKDALGNAIVHPSLIQSLLDLRAEVVRLSRQND